MGYKFKPNKGVLKRFRVTKTGKLKHEHELNSHRRSVRTAKKKRALGRPSILAEGHSRNMRKFAGISGLKPRRAAANKALAAKKSEAKSK
jgi:large subunit ribosomal protein L35